MKVITSPLYLALALAFTFHTTIAYLPSIADMIQQAQKTEIKPADPSTVPASVHDINFTITKTSIFNRKRPNVTQEFQYFNFTPGPIPASHLIKPRADCAVPSTGSGGGSGVRGEAIMGKRSSIALLIGLVGAGILL